METTLDGLIAQRSALQRQRDAAFDPRNGAGASFRRLNAKIGALTLRIEANRTSKTP
jgi:hypothetical protein